MAKLSRLSPEQKEELMSQQSVEGSHFGPAPTADLHTRALIVETPDEESFESRSNFLKDLAKMEAMVSADLARLQKEKE